MRRLTIHRKVTYEGEELQVLILWEEGVNKEAIKKENPYSKTQELLINRGQSYDFISKRA